MERKKLKLLLGGGGTGGHIFPVLAVLEAMRSLPSLEVEVSHVGSASALEQDILRREGISSEPLDVAGLRGSNPIQLIGRAIKMAAATRQARRVLERLEPDAVFTAGGYASVPVVLAAKLCKAPVLLFSADVSAGLAIRLEARLARRIAVPVYQATAGLPKEKCFVSGYPVRPELLRPMARRDARKALGFDPARPLLLCFGGSQGARALNQALSAGLDQLLPLTQVLHITGATDEPRYAPLASDGYHVRAFMSDMPVALAAADLCICRAGASTLGELPAVGLPAVLVPGPFAGGHQRFNAQVLEEAGGAVIVSNEDALAGRLVPRVIALLSDAKRLAAMSAAMRGLARPDAAGVIARELAELAA